MLEPIILYLKGIAESIISAMGYPGIALLMCLDSANIPIPSEVIMPFGGILASKGTMNLHLVALSGTIGSTIGSGISYWIGAKLGKPFLLKYGKYVLLRPKEIEHAESWFEKYGLIVTLWGRFVPLVRTFISLPAGFFRANFGVFLIYAFLGALPWSYLWTWLGFKLGQHWETVHQNMKYVDYVVLLALVVLIAKFLHYRFRKASEDATNDLPPSH
ncbi:MAG: DedA family protein [Armatimonadetes bacterium]|nr:DedA family protein [Armatimonadota bacterium]